MADGIWGRGQWRNSHITRVAKIQPHTELSGAPCFQRFAPRTSSMAFAATAVTYNFSSKQENTVFQFWIGKTGREGPETKSV